MMANNAIEMRKIRELLRLKFEQNQSARKSAIILKIGKTAASQYVAGFKSSGLDIQSISQMSDSDLLKAINIKKETTNTKYQELSSQFSYFEKELKRVGVTLQLLWQEYSQSHADCYGYSQFCHHYFHWRKDQKVSMHMEHKAGDKMFVDFTGKKLSTVNAETGEITEYEVFVSILGASQYAYIEAVLSQTKTDWIMCNEHALRFYGGVPAAIVPDCLKSAVTHPDKYEPQINESFHDFSAHYHTSIVPARALHPKDKSLVENYVRNAYTQIFAPLRNITFFSLAELNNALWEQLDIFNNKNFQGKEYSRKLLFKEIEQEQLQELPLQLYDFKTFNNSKVQYNHHVYLKEDKHYYSVPFLYTGKKVLITSTSTLVEIYFNNSRIATHQRNRHQYGYTTKQEHRPLNHQYISDWNPTRFKSWGHSISTEVEEVIANILDRPEHPEQAYRTCMGLLNLEKKHERDNFIKACKKALVVKCVTYKFIKNILTTKAFNLSVDEELSLFSLPKHDNIRGKSMYN